MGSSDAFWYLPNQVIYVLNIGELSVEDLREVDRQIITLMQQAQAQGIDKIHVFIDSTRLDKLPHLEYGHILHYMGEPVCGITVVVGNHKGFVPILARFVSNFSQISLYMFDTAEEGKDYVETHLNIRSSLRDPQELSEAYIRQRASV